MKIIWMAMKAHRLFLPSEGNNLSGRIKKNKKSLHRNALQQAAGHLQQKAIKEVSGALYLLRAASFMIACPITFLCIWFVPSYI